MGANTAHYICAKEENQRKSLTIYFMILHKFSIGVSYYILNKRLNGKALGQCHISGYFGFVVQYIGFEVKY